MTLYLKRDGAELRVARCGDPACVRRARQHGYAYATARAARALERRHLRRKAAVVRHVEGALGIVTATGQLAMEGWT